MIAIIPARGESKGIERKNIKSLAGKPLISYTIESSLKVREIERTFVSTDFSDIAKIAREYGAEVIYRPPQISSDKSLSEEALLHVLEYLGKEEDYTPEILVFLQCTSPLILTQDIEAVIQKFKEEEADVAFSVTPTHSFLWHQNESGEAEAVNHDKNIRLPRQEKTPEYRETGSIYVMKVDGFKKARHRFFGKTVFAIIPKERSVDIDDMFDWNICETIMRERQQNGSD